MKCDKCNSEMTIDEWGGWKWTCFHCDNVGRYATDEEIKQYEKEFAELLNKK